MADGGYELDIDKMRATAKRAGTYSETAGQTSSVADAASVPPISWGLIGMTTVHPFYLMMLDGLKEHIQRMAAGFQSIEKKLSSAADTYHQQEQGVKRAMKSIEDELHGNSAESGGGSAGGMSHQQATEAVNPDGGALS